VFSGSLAELCNHRKHLQTTRLETRTKESNLRASPKVVNLVAK
jgi:hypothetical protein